MTQMCAGRRRTRRRRGFTLIEVLIVLAIVLALAGLVGVAVLGRGEEAKVDLAKVDMNTLKAALKQFKFDYGRWPTEEEGLAVLWDREMLDPEEDPEAWRPYLEEPLASDRWNNPWGYRAESEFGEEGMYDLWSNGPDGEEGTEDDISARPSSGDDAGGEFGDDGLLPPPP